MIKTLGIDLGTNSIGLTLRNGNDFEWFGVYTFKKGVGEGKAGEFSFAAERTKHRSSRRLYNARRYRKWETLKVLIENGFCPLKLADLNNWKTYAKGAGRVYPIDSREFDSWLKLDFSNNGKPDYTSPYQLRKELIEKRLDCSTLESRYKIGRALYHIAQRRGFKSSRKLGANEKTAVYKGSSKTKTIGRNDYEILIHEKGSLGAALASLEDNNVRLRNRYTLRKDYLDEVIKILNSQGLQRNPIYDNVQKAIFYQRPLRSQKGLVGKCTLEPNKSRCPISHPNFEEFRAWSYINNIKYKDQETKEWAQLPMELRSGLFQDVFLRIKASFPFSDIRKYIEKNGNKDWELNYKKKADKVSVSGCPISARFKSVFGEEWKKFSCTVCRKDQKGKPKEIQYDIYDIWHLLFSFEDEEYFIEFVTDVLCLESEQIEGLIRLWNQFPVGYANLSLKAINNILPFLREGLIYTEAVLQGKIPELIGTERFLESKSLILEAISDEIHSNRDEKRIVAITNSLISKYYLLDYPDRHGWKDSKYVLDEKDSQEALDACASHFGGNTWFSKSEIEQKEILEKVKDKYQSFFSSSNRKHYHQPHLSDQIKEWLLGHFEELTEKQVDKLYHPSQIDIYPSTEDQEFLDSPKTAAFKNPMAYKTLFQLRRIINYLVEIGKIDSETRMVVEVARELNDSNKRWAIEAYQRKRESENREFALAISELTKESDFHGNADPNNKADIDKFRLWLEQLKDNEEILKKINATENDVKKMRLWKEQGCVCMYTGEIIKLTDLFNENIIDFEHTIARSKSFDNSLANQTVCYASYNRNVKKNKLPTELPNYEIDSKEGTAIKPRLKQWQKKVNELKNQIEFWRFKSKTAMDKDKKDEAVQQRYLRKFDYDYWKNKVDRFIREDIPSGFKNSQLIDTQIISKYAFHYLKTVFNRVDVQKGSVTDDFRKIMKVQPREEKKDRSKHHHHAMDAAVLTLIPKHAERDKVLANWYKSLESNNRTKAYWKPFDSFHQSMVTGIEKTILINNIPNKDQALTPSKKIVRRRGKVVWLRDKNGKIRKDKNGDKIPKIARGDSIRGQLHLDTFYGKIKVAEKDESGSLIEDKEGNILYKQVDGKDEIWMVIRKPIEDVNFKSDVIIDQHLCNFLKEQLISGTTQTQLEDFQGNYVRHLRCRVKSGRGFMNPKNVTVVKSHTYKSRKDYKQYYYADSGDNYAFALYETEKRNRKIESVNLFEAAKINSNIMVETPSDLFQNEISNIGRSNETGKLKHVFQVGQKVILFLDTAEELKDLEIDELSKRLYFVKKLADAKAQRILFQYHLEARNDTELSRDFPRSEFGTKGKDGFSSFSADFVAPRLLLTPTNFDFIIEGKDFEMSLDGTIKFIF